MHHLPHLSYEYDALEPVIDVKTMQIHHTRHHQGYINKLNNGLSVYPQYEDLSVVDLLKRFDELPDDLKSTARKHGGGHANHSLFWRILCPVEKSETSKNSATVLLSEIDKVFGSLEKFQEQLVSAGTSQFGSGRVRLVKDNDKKLQILTTSNQDSPYMSGLVPLFGIDVREHAYYLNYQNKRADYISAALTIINREEVQRRYTDEE